MGLHSQVKASNEHYTANLTMLKSADSWKYSLKSYPMPHKHPDLVWQIRIGIVGVGLAELVGQQ